MSSPVPSKNLKENSNSEDNSSSSGSGKKLILPPRHAVYIPSDESSEPDKPVAVVRCRKRKQHIPVTSPSKRQRESQSPSPNMTIAPIQNERLFPRPPWTVYSIWVPAWKFLGDDRMPSNSDDLIRKIVRIVSTSFSIVQGAIVDGYQCHQVVRVFNTNNKNTISGGEPLQIDGLQWAPSAPRPSTSKAPPAPCQDQVVTVNPPPSIQMILAKLVSPMNTLVMFNSNPSTPFHEGFTCVHISLRNYSKKHDVHSFIHSSLLSYQYRFTLVESTEGGMPVTVCKFSPRNLPPPAPASRQFPNLTRTPADPTPVQIQVTPPTQPSTPSKHPEVIDISTQDKDTPRSPSEFNLQAWLQSGDFVPGPLRPKLEKAKKYVYHKLAELSSKLETAAEQDVEASHLPNMMIKRQCYTYGVVVLVPQVKTERQQTTYLVRISDETLNSVLVRIHTTSRINTLGPTSSVGQIIRLHRVNVQMEWDNYVHTNAMVLSTCPHHSYTLFEPGSQPSQFIFHTCAKSITLSDFDKQRVGELQMVKSKLIAEAAKSADAPEPVGSPEGELSPADTVIIPRHGNESRHEERIESRHELHETPRTSSARASLLTYLTMVCKITEVEYIPVEDTFKFSAEPIRAEDCSIPDVIDKLQKLGDSDDVVIRVINVKDFVCRDATFRMFHEGIGDCIKVQKVAVIGADPPYLLELNGATCTAVRIETSPTGDTVETPPEVGMQQNGDPVVAVEGHQPSEGDPIMVMEGYQLTEGDPVPELEVDGHQPTESDLDLVLEVQGYQPTEGDSVPVVEDHQPTEGDSVPVVEGLQPNEVVLVEGDACQSKERVVGEVEAHQPIGEDLVEKEAYQPNGGDLVPEVVGHQPNEPNPHVEVDAYQSNERGVVEVEANQPNGDNFVEEDAHQPNGNRDDIVEVEAIQPNEVEILDASPQAGPPATPSSSKPPQQRTPVLILTKLATPSISRAQTQVPVEKKEARRTGSQSQRGRRPRLQHYQPESEFNC